jgi:putative transposase
MSTIHYKFSERESPLRCDSTPFRGGMGVRPDTEGEERFKELVEEVCEELEIVIVAYECDKDHTHMFLNALPTLSPADIMAKVKGITSKKLREEFPHLRHLPSLWTRSYFVSTAGNVSSETIKRYVEQQKTRG